MPWLLDEDEALKTKLTGIKVGNRRSELTNPQTSVPVWFRFPDPEEIQRTFPHIAIDLVDVVFDRTRAAHAFTAVLDYVPEGATPPDINQSLMQPDLPLPWALQYQVSAFSRNPIHDRQLWANLFQLFPWAYGFLDMTSLDGTIRRVDLVGTAQRDRVDEENKRIYQKVFSISVSSEFSLFQAIKVWNVIQGAVVTVENFDTLYESFPVNPTFPDTYDSSATYDSSEAYDNA